ncbi:MAG TPA: cytochrome o ubiquinol oxidase subunit III [Patescibacteria group bacterium]|nr:cytochrome o ubiquinol oxidase subunit III [Patescibacteria group bacterium]
MIFPTEQIKTDRKAETAAFGFWLYLMTDLIMFAALFAAYAVLQRNTFGGPSGQEIFSLPYVLAETLILLTSSFTCGMAVLALEQSAARRVGAWLAATFALGAAFLLMELSEFGRLLAEGAGPQRSAFLSSYFTLVGAHGLHIAIGLLWLIFALIMLARRGLKPHLSSQIRRLALFWHFLDLVWIFIFTTVYLRGLL